MGLGSSKSTDAKKKKRKQAAHAQVSDKDRAVLDLKNARDRLHRVRKRVEEDEKKLYEQASKHMKAKEQRKAVLCMKMRKGKLKRLEDVEGQLLGIYELTQSIEFQSEQVSVFNALREGKDALKMLHEEMNAEAVIKLMDEIQVSERVIRFYVGARARSERAKQS